MSLIRMRRNAAPLALLVIAVFLLSMTPRKANADNPSPAANGVSPIVETTPEIPEAPAEPASSPKATAQSPGVVKIDTPPQTTALPEPISLPTGENKSGVSSKAISVPTGPGTIQGMGESFSAQPSTGIATFSVPFALPKARGAAQPSLSLGYSSSSGSGVAGIGWDVSVPFISRQTDRGLPHYQDQAGWHPGQDTFVYNGGQELVPICDVGSTCSGKLLDGEQMPVWAEGWQYFRPRVEGSYLRFFWNPSQQLWRVQDKSGVVLELGGNTNALEVDPSNSAQVFRWNLSRQIDAHGNQVKYSYRLDNGIAYIQDIYDTPPAQGDPTNLSLWAHHTRLEYEARPDPSTSYNRGWKVVRALRLTGVDVTSVKDETASTRKLVRRYHLSYDDKYHVSLLESLQVEGRCDVDVAESSTGALPSTSCQRLPKMLFGYTHVGNAEADKFEPFDTTLRHVANSPKHSVDEQYTDLYDVNSDGLPDVVAMMPGTYGGKHGLWLNSEGGDADKFGAQRTIGVKGVLGANESVITKSNSNVVALDLDGDATIDLLHMPKIKTYSVYTPTLVGTEWWWSGRAVTTSDQLDSRIDFTSDAAELRVFDVNGDGLVDVVKSGGTSYQVWFSLGRYPGGDGLFGSAQWTGASTATLSMDPVHRCVPWSATPVRFSDSDTKLADMNGDGLTDIVRVRQGDIRYWPGRGDGTFGTGPLGCTGNTFSQNSHIAMSLSPQYADPNGSFQHLDDVNGDGTADLVQVRFNAVDVWLNIDGTSWTDRRILSNTPASPSYQDRVRLVDMNGSGTRDILWGDAQDYKYIDLSAGKRPWLLTEIANGLGKTTEVGYATSTEQMLAAEKAGKKWTHKSPTVLQVVDQVTVRDNLGAVGRPAGKYVTEYTYANPVYDGLQREFRGFSRTEIKTLGDANSPTSMAATEFDLGERPTAFELDCSPIDYTNPANRWRDNPKEALKGLATLSESWDPQSGVYLASGHQSYTLRRLYQGRDGRSVFAAFESRSDSILYDTSSFGGGTASATVPLVTLEDRAPGACKPDKTIDTQLTFRGVWGAQRTRKEVVVDSFGNRTRELAYGVDGYDEVITTTTVAALHPTPAQTLGEGGWSWRTVESWVSGDKDLTQLLRHHSKTDYNGYGDPTWTEVEIQGTLPLDRSAPGGAATAQPPGDRSVDGWTTTSQTWYDEATGNVILEAGPNGRCREVDYDLAHAQLPIAETAYAGTLTSATIHGVTLQCGARGLQTLASYDRGLQAIASTTDPSGARTEVRYDGFGRMKELYRPSPETPGETSAEASIKVEYHLPDETGRPVSFLATETRDDSSDGYQRAYAYVDGLGRTIVTLSEADTVQDGFEWVAQGLTDYDAKGAARRKYLSWEYNGDPAVYDLSMPAQAKYAQQRYDAFGRPIESTALDGTVALRTRYHALSADAWDAEDLGPGPHQGTFASETKDGHGRVVRTTERVRSSGQIEERHVDSAYLPSGEVKTITRRKGAAALSREIQYDTLGRMVLNWDQNTSYAGRDWRYAYNDSGDLVGTSDARGCGVNYAYDTAGRLLSEDYSPCEAHHALYDADPEVVYYYDEPDPEGSCLDQGQLFTNGRLVSVTDAASKSISRYDGRGRVVQVGRRVNSPTGVATAQWFCKRTSYDAADRPKKETTGATAGAIDPENSWVEPTYSERGTVVSVNSSHGSLVDQVKRDADGLVTEITYGSNSIHTTTAFSYDDLRRLRNLTTYRASLPSNVPAATGQMLLQDEQYEYDRVGNPTAIRDWRIASEWENGFKPATRKMKYDDLYRLTQIDYEYPAGTDPWVDPYLAESQDSARAQPSPRADFTGANRPTRQSWEYDWLGNTTRSDDDAHAFYDRSLGNIEQGPANNVGPYQLWSANNASFGGSRTGNLDAQYDPSGNLTSLNVYRDGPCIPVGKCNSQHFLYEWDEVGRLVRARRWDAGATPVGEPDAELQYAYDASNSRVRKSVVAGAEARHDIYIFGSLELRLAEWTGVEYGVTEQSEVVYLFAHGVRLGRVVHVTDPELGSPSTRVFLELGDHLGSTSVVLDRASGELVERSTAYAYGAPESSYRPGRWESFREDYRFTGKEDDIDVGLVYFGARYLNPLLGRWISADPLGVHAPGQADLNLYAYVHGRVLVAVDAQGLECEGTAGGCGPAPGTGLKPPTPEDLLKMGEDEDLDDGEGDDSWKKQWDKQTKELVNPPHPAKVLTSLVELFLGGSYADNPTSPDDANARHDAETYVEQALKVALFFTSLRLMGASGESVDPSIEYLFANAKSRARALQATDAAQKGGRDPVVAGQQGEAVVSDLLGLPKNTQKIWSDSRKKSFRVPDFMEPQSQRYIAETKNVDYQYLSSQLLDDAAHVTRGGMPGRVDVIIDTRTQISTSLLRAHLNPGGPIKVQTQPLAIGPGQKL